MFRIASFGLMLLVAASSALAQRMPSSIEDAEDEGSAFPHGAAPARVASVFSRSVTGTSERRCVMLTPELHSTVRPPRSGEFIIRYGGLVANRPEKILWFPLHNPGDYPSTLLIRAVRLGHPADSLRVALRDWAWASRRARTESGFPSTLRFPSGGTWLVIATAGQDWGCFRLAVAD